MNGKLPCTITKILTDNKWKGKPILRRIVSAVRHRNSFAYTDYTMRDRLVFFQNDFIKEINGRKFDSEGEYVLFVDQFIEKYIQTTKETFK